MAKARGLWLCCVGGRSVGGKKGFHPFHGICLPPSCSEPQSRGRKPGERPRCRCRGGCANCLSIHRPLAQGPLQQSRTLQDTPRRPSSPKPSPKQSLRKCLGDGPGAIGFNLEFLSRLRSMPIGSTCPFTECADELRKERNVLMRLLIHPAQRRIRAECKGDEPPA